MSGEKKMFDPLRDATAVILCFGIKDYRIVWDGPKGRWSADLSYKSKEAAVGVAESLGARKVST